MRCRGSGRWASLLLSGREGVGALAKVGRLGAQSRERTAQSKGHGRVEGADLPRDGTAKRLASEEQRAQGVEHKVPGGRGRAGGRKMGPEDRALSSGRCVLGS